MGPVSQPMSPLRRWMLEDMSTRGLRQDTQRDYIRFVRSFAEFLRRPPASDFALVGPDGRCYPAVAFRCSAARMCSRTRLRRLASGSGLWAPPAAVARLGSGIGWVPVGGRTVAEDYQRNRPRFRLVVAAGGQRMALTAPAPCRGSCGWAAVRRVSSHRGITPTRMAR
jgi:hypothetical protein